MTARPQGAPARSAAGAELAPVPEPQLAGRLECDAGEALPVRVACASRISLFVAFEAHVPLPEDQSVFRQLVLSVGGHDVVLSACRFIAEETAGGWAGRLVFTEDVYDCRTLLGEGTVLNLRNFFQQVPLVLAQRDGVRPEFRTLVADALYDLSVHKKFLDEQDRILDEEPADAAEAAWDTLLRTTRGPFFAWMDTHVRRLEACVEGFSREEHARHGFYLRRQAWPYIVCSEFLRRTNLKPRGYAGDAETMEILYANSYMGVGLFGMLLHKHPVEHPAAQAVRNRRRLIPGMLRETLARFPRLPSHAFRFLSVASGPARELQEILVTPDDLQRMHCSLLDQDATALELARQTVARVEAPHGGIRRASVSYLHESVRTMLRERDLPGRFGRFHFIYSMGLFDYLTTPVARAVLTHLFGLLEPGGSLVVGNYHPRCASRIYMDYWVDWPLLYRTEESFLELASGLTGVEPSITFDETGSQMFLRLTRL